MPPILPVIDLKDGLVVRAVAGRRQEYRPVASCLTSDSSPGSIAHALVEQLESIDAYVADIGAIQGNPIDGESLLRIVEAGLHLIVDAGTANRRQAAALLSIPALREHLAGIVMGLESTCCLKELRETIESIGVDHSVFSLDLRDGRPMTDLPPWRNLSPESIAVEAAEMGFRRFIVLDLARVGVSQGTGLETICQSLRTQLPEVELIAGGGVRDRSDVDHLLQAGCNAVLVGSALHDGRFKRLDLPTG